ncbi:tRNA pseudouridine(55) synthase TruB [Rubripirellula obstinata]|nr:tRNA pseudouridine(55) synthase TruB [Rubripirellula obstinata]
MTPFGFLCCDKPVGMTSRDAVNIVAGCLRKSNDGKKVKVGHAGTLDPLAEGVLVLAVGRAVRLVPYVQQQSKFYRATFLLGQSTVSGDTEGEVTVRDDLPMPNRNQLDAAAASLRGTITQIPPAHSAIKIDGKRAYDLVRAGKEVVVPSRQVIINHLDITRFAPPEFDLDIGCGSGTYIRTLGIDLANAAGSVAVMTYLRRYAVGVFHERDSIPIDEIRNTDPCQFLRPGLDAVGYLPSFQIDDDQARRLINGLDLNLDALDDAGNVVTSGDAAAIWKGELFAVVHRRKIESQSYQWWPKRVFPRD